MNEKVFYFSCHWNKRAIIIKRTENSGYSISIFLLPQLRETKMSKRSVQSQNFYEVRSPETILLTLKVIAVICGSIAIFYVFYKIFFKTRCIREKVCCCCPEDLDFEGNYQGNPADEEMRCSRSQCNYRQGGSQNPPSEVGGSDSCASMGLREKKFEKKIKKNFHIQFFFIKNFQKFPSPSHQPRQALHELFHGRMPPLLQPPRSRSG